MNYTPGPWKLCWHLQDKEKDQRCTCGFHGDIWGNDEEHIVCSIGVPHVDPSSEMMPRYEREIERANARLIAAAPDMYEMLKTARDTFIGLECQETRLFKAIVKVIAKAEGSPTKSPSP